MAQVAVARPSGERRRSSVPWRSAAARAGTIVLVLAVMWGLWELYRWVWVKTGWTHPFPVNDTTIDGVCAGMNWLRLGKGADQQAIVTDADGAGQAELFRDLSAVPTGMEFDIRFRVVDGATSGVVLQSGCYQFTVSQ